MTVVVTLDEAGQSELEEAVAALAGAHRWAAYATADGDARKLAAANLLIGSWRATVSALLAAAGDGVLGERSTSGAGGRSLSTLTERSPR